MKRLLIGTLLLVGAVHCGNFIKQSDIARVRVLAIKATPAEIALSTNDGGTAGKVALDTLALNADGGTVPVRIALCRVGNPYSVTFECPGKDGIDLDGGTLDLSDPNYAMLLVDGGVDLSGSDGGYLITLGYLADDGSGTPDGLERGVRTILARPTDHPHQNPQLEGLSASTDAGAALSLTGLPLGQQIVLTSALDGGADPDAGLTYYSWYAINDDGLQNLRSQEPFNGTGDRTSLYQTPAKAKPVTLYVVVRDGLGGTDWISQTIGFDGGTP